MIAYININKYIVNTESVFLSCTFRAHYKKGILIRDAPIRIFCHHDLSS